MKRHRIFPSNRILAGVALAALLCGTSAIPASTAPQIPRDRSRALAAVRAGPVDPEGIWQRQSPVVHDFVSGEGWITGTPSGGRADFAFAGGIEYGQLWGHLSYTDRGERLELIATAITGYFRQQEQARILEGVAQIDGRELATFRIVVSDGGPVTGVDHFELRLSTGYVAAGTLQEGDLQLHTSPD